MSNMDCFSKIKLFCKRGQIISVRVHVVSIPGLGVTLISFLLPHS
jgi:hypothetical protein